MREWIASVSEFVKIGAMRYHVSILIAAAIPASLARFNFTSSNWLLEHELEYVSHASKYYGLDPLTGAIEIFTRTPR